MYTYMYMYTHTQCNQESNARFRLLPQWHDSVPNCMSCHKAIVVITGRARCFHDNINITLILLLWDLRTLCVVDHLWPLMTASIYIYYYYYYYYYCCCCCCYYRSNRRHYRSNLSAVVKNIERVSRNLSKGFRGLLAIIISGTETVFKDFQIF